MFESYYFFFILFAADLIGLFFLLSYPINFSIPIAKWTVWDTKEFDSQLFFESLKSKNLTARVSSDGNEIRIRENIAINRNGSRLIIGYTIKQINNDLIIRGKVIPSILLIPATIVANMINKEFDWNFVLGASFFLTLLYISAKFRLVRIANIIIDVIDEVRHKPSSAAQPDSPK